MFSQSPATFLLAIIQLLNFLNSQNRANRIYTAQIVDPRYILWLIFFILQVAPDGPFDRAIKQLKNQQNANQEVSTSSDVIGKSNELRPEVIEKLRAEYGLDRNIFIRYLMWIGLWPKDMNIKKISYLKFELNY